MGKTTGETTGKATGETTGEDSTLSMGFGKVMAAPFEQAIERVTMALKGEGFGVLTTIDVRATMKAKLDVDFQPYTILGACNPQLAYQALSIAPQVGLLLPCNVVVRQWQPDVDGTPQTYVEIADPQALLGAAHNGAIDTVASEARARLERVLAAL